MTSSEQKRTFPDMLGRFSIILLACHAYGFFFSFLYVTERTSIPPRYYAFLLLATTLLFTFLKWREGYWIRVWRPAFIWFVSACLLGLAYYALGRYGDFYLVEGYASQFFHGLVIMMCGVILLNADSRLFPVLCQMVRILFLVACLVIIFDYYFPGIFVMPKSVYSNFGRGAGHYVNANIAGSAVVCGLIFIFMAYKSNARYFYPLMAVGTYALIVSFSRSSWLSAVFVLCMALVFRVIKPKMFMNIIGLVILNVILYNIIIFFGSVQWMESREKNQWTESMETLQLMESMETLQLMESAELPQWMTGVSCRIDFIRPLVEKASRNKKIDRQCDSILLNDSALQRIVRMKLTMKTIELSPILGSGFGSTKYVFKVYPHNSYLELWADFGVLGLLLVLSLLVIMFSRFFGEENDVRKFCFLAGCFLFVQGMFSGLILNGPILLCIIVSLSSFSFKSVRR
jgi:hypothetical protein